jgi:hypothetical protein
MRPGDVIHIWLGSEHLGGGDAKFKYLIRMDEKERRFLAINSELRRHRPDDNVRISHNDAPFLPNPISYVDTSRVISLGYTEFTDGMAKRGAKAVGSISDDCKARLLENVAKSKVLPKWQKDMIARNLASNTATQAPKDQKA